MLSLIKKYDFAKATEKIKDDFTDDRNELEEKPSKANISKILDAFKAKVLVEYYPKEHSPGYDIATYCLAYILGQIR